MNYNWVFTVGNRRSGSTVHYHYTRELLEAAGVGRGYGAVPNGAIGDADWSILDYKTTEGIKAFRTHRATTEVVQILMSEPTKIVYIFRDIRDAMVSVLDREKDKTLDWILTSGWISNRMITHNFFCSRPDVLVTRYEDMMGDHREELRRIANFLQIEDLISLSTIDKIIEKYDINKVKEDFKRGNNGKVYTQEEQGWAVGDGGYKPFLSNHVRSGEWGQFMTFFTHKELEKIEQQCGAYFQALGYPSYKDLLE